MKQVAGRWMPEDRSKDMAGGRLRGWIVLRTTYVPQEAILSGAYIYLFLESVEELSSLGNERNPPSSAPGYGMHRSVVKGWSK